MFIFLLDFFLCLLKFLIPYNFFKKIKSLLLMIVGLYSALVDVCWLGSFFLPSLLLACDHQLVILDLNPSFLVILLFFLSDRWLPRSSLSIILDFLSLLLDVETFDWIRERGYLLGSLRSESAFISVWAMSVCSSNFIVYYFFLGDTSSISRAINFEDLRFSCLELTCSS